MASSEITLEAVSSISQIAAQDWDACANPVSDPDSLDGFDTLASSGPIGDASKVSKCSYNPFVSHAFFAALEASNSACARTGWGPRHLLAKLDGNIAGIVPCYLKSHSQGEYVFDRGWADAYEPAGGLVGLCDATSASSVHVTFAREAEWKFLAKYGFLQRTDQQFHWHNQGYASFDDFLASLNSP